MVLRIDINTEATVADLRLRTNPAADSAVYVLGGAAYGDGRGGLYRFNTASSVADDGHFTVAPPAGSGRWERTLANRARRVLTADVANSTTTIADVTALSFAVTSGATYRFQFLIPFTAAATGTGSLWAINGPATPTLLNYRVRWNSSATADSATYASTYDAGTATTGSLTAGNIAEITGVITPSANGTVIARFRSATAASAITAKAGAAVDWW